MSDKIDLDELERKAEAVARAGWFDYDAGSTPDDYIDEIMINGLDRAHIAANSPPVTLALIARIRELEVQSRRTIDATGLTVEDELEELRQILEKGAVLPW